MGIFSKIFKSYSEKEVKRIMPIVEKINERLIELGLENYSWDISEIDDEIIQSLLEEHYREEE